MSSYSLSPDVWRHIVEIAGFDGNFLFFAPVCQFWHSLSKPLKPLQTGRITGLAQAMASRSTIEECCNSADGKTLLSARGWDFLAEHVNDKNKINGLAGELQTNAKWDPVCVDVAGRHGNINFIRWLQTTTLQWDPEKALSSAALHGNLSFMQIMHEMGYVPGMLSIRYAALYGAVRTIEWLKVIGCCMEDVAQVLAEEGNLSALFWANNNGIPCDEHTMNAAAYGGMINVLDYMVQSGLDFPDNETFLSAASGGSSAAHNYVADLLQRPAIVIPPQLHPLNPPSSEP